MENSQLYRALPWRHFRSRQSFAAKPIRDSFSQSKKMQMDYRTCPEHSGLELRIPQLRGDRQSFLQRHARRLEFSCSRDRLTKDRKQVHAVGTDISVKVGQGAASCLGRFRRAANPYIRVGQFRKALTDHLPILELDINIQRFAKIVQRRIPSFKTELGHRQARQQVSSFPWLCGASI